MHSKRNSLIEIFRLLAAFWVCYYHGFSLITRGSYFSNGRIAVDFFFILSGLFLFKIFKKYDDEPILKGTLHFMWDRFKPVMVTFLICWAFTLVNYFTIYIPNGEYVIPFGFLWYIPHLLLIELVLYLFHRFANSKILFLIPAGIASVVCFVLTLTYLTNYGLFRGFAAVPLGMFISLIPEIKEKYRQAICIPLTIVIFAGVFLVSYFLPIPEYEDPLMILVLFPMLLYFAKQVNFKNGVVNAICSISLGVYCYQNIVGFLQMRDILKTGWIMFLIVLTFAIVDAVAKHIFFFIKQKKSQNQLNPVNE